MGKGRYLVRRLVYIVFVFFIISILMFFIYKSMPGDPVTMMLGESRNNMKPEAYQALYEQTARPWAWTARWWSSISSGSATCSPATLDILPSISVRSPRSSHPDAQYPDAQRPVHGRGVCYRDPPGHCHRGAQEQRVRQGVQVLTIIGYSLPSFIIALLMIFAFAVKIPIFPISGVRSPGFTGTGMEYVLDTLWHMALPVIVMSISGIGSITRYVRAEMIDVLRMDYIKTARAKGLKEKTVIYVHAFRNALIPIVTIATAWVVSLFGGSVVIEQVFLWPGLGQMLINGLLQRDFSVVLTMQMFYVVLALAGNVIMDIAYTIVDPRVRLEN